MSFKGWPPTALEFFEGLEADNSKFYWLAHKEVYERDVRGPMEVLLDELKAEFGQPRLFRPYRDVRFSRDKSPYKTNIAATIGDSYIHLSAQGLGAGSGMYHMAPDQIERYRAAVDTTSSGTRLQALVDVLKDTKIDIYGSDALKTVPKGYPRDHARGDLLRYKGIVAMKSWPVASWLSSAVAKKRVVELLRSTMPLVDWLDQNVGESTMPEASSRHR